MKTNRPGIPGQQRSLCDAMPDGQRTLFDYVPPSKSDRKPATVAAVSTKTVSPADELTVVQAPALPGQVALF